MGFIPLPIGSGPYGSLSRNPIYRARPLVPFPQLFGRVQKRKFCGFGDQRFSANRAPKKILCAQKGEHARLAVEGGMTLREYVAKIGGKEDTVTNWFLAAKVVAVCPEADCATFMLKHSLPSTPPDPEAAACSADPLHQCLTRRISRGQACPDESPKI